MSGVRYGMICLAALVAVHAAPGDETRYVASRQVLLTFAPANGSPVHDVRLWVSSDGGKSWRAEPIDRIGPHTLRYTAPADGAYGFYLVLKNAAGASADPPKDGCEPPVRVIVDTVAPTLQVHAAAPAGFGEPLALRATLIDENLGQMGVRVFYRAPGGAGWTDGGIASMDSAQLAWPVPAGVGDLLDLRVVATDLAGNRAIDELCGVAVRPPGPGDLPESARVAESSTPGMVESARGAGATGSATLSGPQTVSPAVSDGQLRGNVPVSPPRLENLEHLRRLASRFMGERRYDLAAARLEDALRLSPDDAHLLVDLGSALYWSGRYSEADGRFEAALKAFPDHTGALEGLALVAATQKRYPQAREHLLHLLRLAPGSAITRLRYGDVEHKLGNADRAIEAWQAVLELEGAGAAVRAKVEKRLRYFGPARRRTQP